MRNLTRSSWVCSNLGAAQYLLKCCFLCPQHPRKGRKSWGSERWAETDAHRLLGPERATRSRVPPSSSSQAHVHPESPSIRAWCSRPAVTQPRGQVWGKEKRFRGISSHARRPLSPPTATKEPSSAPKPWRGIHRQTEADAKMSPLHIFCKKQIFGSRT